MNNLYDADSGVRFWGIIALIARGKQAQKTIPELKKALTDESPVVQIAAAEALCHLNKCNKALPVLAHHLQDTNRPWGVLQAATSVRSIGNKAKPLLKTVKKVLEENSGSVWGRYKSWLYPMFIGFALDQTLLNCGEKL